MLDSIMNSQHSAEFAHLIEESRNNLSDFSHRIIQTYCETPFAKSLQERISYQFKDGSHLIKSLTHSSFSNELRGPFSHYEKMEFLGDSILQMIVSEKLFGLFQNQSEGKLSKLRSALVNEETLFRLAEYLKLDDCILLGRGERGDKRPKISIMADTFESLIAAIFLDSNYEKTKNVVLQIFENFKKETGEELFTLDKLNWFDSKSKLQELLVKEFKVLPEYRTKEVIENKQQIFEVSLLVKETELSKLRYASKKKAEQILARQALEKKLYKKLRGNQC